MFQMSVPNSYWGEAVLTAVYLINRVISRVLGNTSPIKSMLSHFPSAPILQNLKTRVFGCVAFVHVHKQYRNKLDPRAIRCIFLGYAPNLTKEGANVIILPVEIFLSPKMSLFMRICRILLVLSLRGST